MLTIISFISVCLSRNFINKAVGGAVFRLKMDILELHSPSVLFREVKKIMKWSRMYTKTASSKGHQQTSQDLKLYLSTLVFSTILFKSGNKMLKYQQIQPQSTLLKLSRQQYLRVLSIYIIRTKYCYFQSLLKHLQDATQQSEHY